MLYADSLLCQSVNLSWKVTAQNVGSVVGLFWGRHKNNFLLYKFVAPLKIAIFGIFVYYSTVALICVFSF